MLKAFTLAAFLICPVDGPATGCRAVAFEPAYRAIFATAEACENAGRIVAFSTIEDVRDRADYRPWVACVETYLSTA